MVKTRRSNGENGEVEDRNYGLNDAGNVSDEKTEKVTFLVRLFGTKPCCKTLSTQLPAPVSF